MIIGVIREYPVQELTFNCEEIDENELDAQNCYLTDIREYEVMEYLEKKEGFFYPEVTKKKFLKRHLRMRMGKFNLKAYRVNKRNPIQDDMIDDLELAFGMIDVKEGVFIKNNTEYVAQDIKITPKKPKRKYQKPQFYKYGTIDIPIKLNKEEYEKLITALKE